MPLSLLFPPCSYNLLKFTTHKWNSKQCNWTVKNSRYVCEMLTKNLKAMLTQWFPVLIPIFYLLLLISGTSRRTKFFGTFPGNYVKRLWIFFPAYLCCISATHLHKAARKHATLAFCFLACSLKEATQFILIPSHPPNRSSSITATTAVWITKLFWSKRNQFNI